MLRYEKFLLMIAKLLTAAVLLSSSTPTIAGSDMTESEYRLLPDFCKAQGNVSNRYYGKYYSAARTDKWRRIFGSNFNHFHHYCWGIVSVNRAYRSKIPLSATAGMLKSAIGDIGYVVDRSTPDFVLLPQMFTKLGEAFLLAGDDRSAEQAFRRAWSINPAYWPAYVWWAGRLLGNGQLDEALAVAMEGQKHAPGVKALTVLIKDIHAAANKRPK